jgi:hypothetical protein
MSFSLSQVLAEIQANTSFGNGSMIVTPKINGLPFQFSIPVSQNTEMQMQSIFSGIALAAAVYETIAAHPHTAAPQ